MTASNPWTTLGQQDVADFLGKDDNRLDRTVIGDFLGDSDSFNKSVMYRYADMLDFKVEGVLLSIFLSIYLSIYLSVSLLTTYLYLSTYRYRL